MAAEAAKVQSALDKDDEDFVAEDEGIKTPSSQKAVDDPNLWDVYVEVCVPRRRLGRLVLWLKHRLPGIRPRRVPIGDGRSQSTIVIRGVDKVAMQEIIRSKHFQRHLNRILWTRRTEASMEDAAHAIREQCKGQILRVQFLEKNGEKSFISKIPEDVRLGIVGCTHLLSVAQFGDGPTQWGVVPWSDSDWLIKNVAGAKKDAKRKTPEQDTPNGADKQQPSADTASCLNRARWKIEEALEISNFDLSASAIRTIDIGAAPGGWSSQLAEMGCEVVAIDPGDLTVKKSNIRHMKCTWEEALPTLAEEGKTYNMLVCDMNQSPQSMIDLLLPVLTDHTLLEAGTYFILTFKMFTVKKRATRVRDVAKYVEILREYIEQISVVGLLANTQYEMTLLGKMRKMKQSD